MKKSIICVLVLLSVMLFPNIAFALKINSEVSNFEINNNQKMTNEIEGCNSPQEVKTSDGGIAKIYSFWGTCRINNEAITSAGSFDWLIIKYDKDDEVEWWRQYGGTDQESDGHIFDIGDGILVIGDSHSDNIFDLQISGYSDLVVFKYSYSGDLLFNKSIGGNNMEFLDEVIQTKDNNYLIAASTNSTDLTWFSNSNGDTWLAVIKIDKEGNILWTDCSEAISALGFSKIKENNEKEYIITGYVRQNTISDTNSNNYSDAIILKYDKNGNRLFSDIIGGADSDYFDGVTIVEDGIIAFGRTNSPEIEGIITKGGGDILLAKYDNQGNRLWLQTYGDTEYDELETIHEISNGYVMTSRVGVSKIVEGIEQQNTRLTLVKYDKKGNLLSECILVEAENIYMNQKYSTMDEGIIMYLEYSNSNEITINKIIKYDKNNEIVFEENYNIEYTMDGSIINISGEVPTFNITNDGGFIIATTIVNQKFNPSTQELLEFKLDTYIRKYNKNGELVWQYDYDSETIDMIDTIEELSDGTYRAVGSTMIDVETEEMIGLQIDLTVDYELTQEKTEQGTYSVKQEGNKGVITLSPDKGYTLDKLTITNSKGEKLEYYEENGNYFFLLYDDVKVNVTYKEDVTNPNTITFLKLGFISVIIFAIYNLFISRKIKIKKYS